jgi:hypothetical protein
MPHRGGFDPARLTGSVLIDIESILMRNSYLQSAWQALV